MAEAPGGGALEPFLDALAEGRLDPHAGVFLSAAPEPAPVAGDAPLPPVTYLDDDLDEVVLRVETPRAAVLVLADMMTPGWRVEVDGAPRPLLAADLVLRAVALEAGTHEVRFVFHDPAVGRGLTLTVIGAILILALLLMPLALNRLRPAPDPRGETPVHE